MKKDLESTNCIFLLNMKLTTGNIKTVCVKAVLFQECFSALFQAVKSSLPFTGLVHYTRLELLTSTPTNELLEKQKPCLTQ